MPASLAPISPELLADFRGGKETALEQLFRANFDALTADVTARIEDAAGAQKVVASAFLEVWDRRAQQESAAQLEALLHQAVTSGGAHELRRRASLHRMADTDGDHKNHASRHVLEPESIDQMWARIVGELHAAKVDPAVRAKQLADHSRHEAAAHMAQVAKPQGSKIAIISVIVIAAVVAVPLWYLNRGAETTKAGQLLGREDTRPMKSAAGQRGSATLEDGTEVKMGSVTEVKLTAHFPQDVRALQVTGTASFKAPAGATPLLVKVGSAWVYANGADFIVRSYPDDSGSVMIKATKDSITVKGIKEERVLNAGASAKLFRDGTFTQMTDDLAALAFSWVDGTFAVEHLSLRNTLSEIRKWYGLEIIPLDTFILERPMSMKASLESSKEAVAALEEGGAVKIGFKGLAMVLSDNAAGAAKKKK